MSNSTKLLACAGIASLIAGFVQACASPENNFSGLTDASLNGFPNDTPNGAGGSGSVGAGSGGTSLGSGGTAGACRVAYCPSAGSGSPCCMSDNITCGVDYGMGCVTPIVDAGTGTGGSQGAGGYTNTGGYYAGTGGLTSTGGSSTDAGNGHANTGGASGSETGGAGGGPPPPVTDAAVVHDQP